jgi:hypothetical protein
MVHVWIGSWIWPAHRGPSETCVGTNFKLPQKKISLKDLDMIQYYLYDSTIK